MCVPTSFDKNIQPSSLLFLFVLKLSIHHLCTEDSDGHKNVMVLENKTRKHARKEGLGEKSKRETDKTDAIS